MDDKATSKSIELSDEEMGNISGGGAIIFEDKGEQTLIHYCINKDMHANDFAQCKKGSLRCPIYMRQFLYPPECIHCGFYTSIQVTTADRNRFKSGYESRGLEIIEL